MVRGSFFSMFPRLGIGGRLRRLLSVMFIAGISVGPKEARLEICVRDDH